jgi:hypothetical protein
VLVAAALIQHKEAGRTTKDTKKVFDALRAKRHFHCLRELRRPSCFFVLNQSRRNQHWLRGRGV